MEKDRSIKIVKATQALIDDMMGRLRVEDHIECQAVAHVSAETAMQTGFHVSTKSWVGIYQGKPFCAFGVAPTDIKNVGVPWMLGTDDVKKAYIGIGRYSKMYIDKMLEEYSYLENWVDVENITSINWIRKCGFYLEEPRLYGLDNKPFHRFWLVKEGRKSKCVTLH